MDKRSFEALDCCGFSKEQLVEYINMKFNKIPNNFRILLETPKGNSLVSRITPDMGKLIGIVIDDTLFFAKTYGPDQTKNKLEVSLGDINMFGKHEVQSSASPMHPTEFEVLKENFSDFVSIVKLLKVHGYDMPCPEWFMLIPRKPKTSLFPFVNTQGDEYGQYSLKVFTSFNPILYCARIE